jgi:hypothetical protein
MRTTERPPWSEVGDRSTRDVDSRREQPEHLAAAREAARDAPAEQRPLTAGSSAPPSGDGTTDVSEVALPDPRLALRRVAHSFRCRCGTRLQTGDVGIALEGVPEFVERLFDTQVFCNFRCIRAEFLELLETMDSLVGSPGEELVLDLRPTYAQLAREFASLLHE